MATAPLSRILLLVSFFFFSVAIHGALGVSPSSCERFECPGFDVIDVGKGFEIRRYNSAEWISTSPIDNTSLVATTRTGFLQLFDYIRGKNEYGAKINMTAPVLTAVSPSAATFRTSSFVVSFYVPRKNQPNPPPAEGLHVHKWGVEYAAVRQFGGFVSDDSVGDEVVALLSSLAGTKWSSLVNKGSKAADPKSVYTLAQYNSPFESTGRVNEIWMMFEMPDAHARS